MKSNVKLRSNVYVRRPVRLREDADYRSQVHGRDALRKLLDQIEIFDTPERARRWLTDLQLSEWNQTLKCADCETQATGPVRVPTSLGQVVRLAFRCPRGNCPYSD
jgi:hypothetical protein